MARYTGPRTKIARKFGDPIFGTDKSFERKNYPPGQQGGNKRRKKVSEYGVQLMEKQKARSFYDLLVSEETSRYLYRILAMKLIFEQPEKYGFYIEETEYYLPIPYHVVEVDGKIENWADFAKENGISYKILKYFNPWLRKTYLKNRNNNTYFIKIPDPPYNLTHEQLILMQNGIRN